MTRHLFSAAHRLCAISTLLFLALAASCLCSCSNTEYEIYSSVYGIVVDYETGEPIHNALVVLSPTNITKHTGADGAYRFDDLDAQQYTITFQKAGYQANRKLVNAISGEELEVNIFLKKIQQ